MSRAATPGEHIPTPTSRKRRSRDRSDVDLETGEKDEQISTVDAGGAIIKLSTFIFMVSLWLSKLKNMFKVSLPEDSYENFYAADFKIGTDKFQNDACEKFPTGWASTAAFLISGENTTIFRSFSYVHTRILLSLQADITELEEKLKSYDERDNQTPEDVECQQRLQGRRKRTVKVAQDEILEKLESKIKRYDKLLLRFSRIKELEETPKEDHMSVFRWIWQLKPLLLNEYNWIYHHEDFVTLIKSESNVFGELLWRNSMSRYGRFFKTGDQKGEEGTTLVNCFSPDRIDIFVRVSVVFSAVTILFIPVMLFYMTSMTKGAVVSITLVFVFLFSIIMSIQKKCEVHEMFVGTATYCAVLVTFLGNLVDAEQPAVIAASNCTC